MSFCSSRIAKQVVKQVQESSFLPPRSAVFERRSKVIAALKACSASENLELGKSIHETAIHSGDVSDIYIATTLISMYAKCSRMEEARRVFECIQLPNVVSWTALITGYVDNGQTDMALDQFSRMRREGFEPNERTIVAVLKVCTDLVLQEEENDSLVEMGKQLHLLASRFGCDSCLFVRNTLVDMYTKCGCIEEAREVFESFEGPDAVSWTALILGYAHHGEGLIALDLFLRMRREQCAPNARTFVAALRACIDLEAKEGGGNSVGSGRRRGKQLHLLASQSGFDTDPYVRSVLLDLYAKCGIVDDARRVFESMQVRDVVSWTTFILAYADNGESSAALDFFLKMMAEGCAPDARTFVAALKACSGLADKEEANANFVKAASREKGRSLHLLAAMKGCYPDHFVGNTLVDMYAKCGCMEDARRVFEGMVDRDVVSWTALIFGYAENGDGALALELFTRMRREGFVPNSRTFIAALKACGMVGALDFGKALAEICNRSFKQDTVLVTCLVDFYAKCGSLIEAKKVFDLRMSQDLATWNALLTGYSRQGDADAVIGLFERMQQANVRPDRVTFLCLLIACSHANLVDKGKEYFDLMATEFRIPSGLEHYSCMADMLGRGNKLDEAMVLLRNMPLVPNSVTWMTVLGACRKWKNVRLGRMAFDSLDEKQSGAYALMSNLYASRGMWEDRATIRSMRKKLKVWKKPGESWWTNGAGVVHAFLVDDRSHPQSQQLHEKLKELMVRLREHGYIADLASVTRNISDLEKEDALCGHSERLAIACALINTNAGETIRIFKNLRVCDDCHAATALISKLELRTIICRDATRFHVFKDGKCSCGDFW